MGGKGSRPAPLEFQVPPLPSAKGSTPVTFATVEVQMQAGFGRVKANMDLVRQTIGSGQFAGAGHVLKACYLPVMKTGKHRGVPVEREANGLFSGKTKVHLVFAHESHSPLETMIVEVQIRLRAGLWSVDLKSTDPLTQAIQTAAEQGYRVTGLIDAPDSRLTGLRSVDTTVWLITQRASGPQPPATGSRHLVVGVPMTIRASLMHLDCEIPSLVQTLTHYGQQCYRVCAVYDPPVVSASGLFTGESSIILVFEQTSEPWVFSICDAPVYARQSGFAKIVVDNSPCQSIVNGFSQTGWQLAGMLDIPKQSTSGLLSATLFVKLIFQAQASWSVP